MAKFREIFRGKSRYVTVRPDEGEAAPKKEVPDNLWTKCPGCRTLLYNKDLDRNMRVCDKCGHHFPITAAARLEHLLDDPQSFTEIDSELVSADPLDFPQYAEKLERDQEKTGENDAIITGIGRIGGVETVIAVMEFSFMGGSMGSVVGERITRAFEYATKHRLPVLTFAASGGARMQEGILSLMQMQKTSAAVWAHGCQGLLYISVLTHPTLAGVFGSFASLGDVNIAETGATIGFAGQRVIEETIRKAVPPNLQKAETVFENGFIDKIVARPDLKEAMSKLLLWHTTTHVAADPGSDPEATIETTADIADEASDDQTEDGKQEAPADDPSADDPSADDASADGAAADGASVQDADGQNTTQSHENANGLHGGRPVVKGVPAKK